MKTLIILSCVMLLSCTADVKTIHSESNQENIGDKDQKTQSSIVENEKLSTAASNGETFEGHYYSVLTAQKAQVYQKVENDIVKSNFQLERGAVYTVNNKVKAPTGFLAVSVPDKANVLYLRRPVEHFDQPLEGMRFLVQGTITDDNAEMEFYDTEVGKRVKHKLDVGTNYFFMNYKDCAVINVWQDKDNKAIEGMYCGKLNILQASDHIKINPKYASTLEKWLLNE